MSTTRLFARACVVGRPSAGPPASTSTAMVRMADRAAALDETTSASWTAVMATTAVAVWLVSAIYMWHFGRPWHLDLRVYRAAGRALLEHGTPFRSSFTTDHLTFTYPPFALLVLTPLSFGPLGLVEGLWWTSNSLALVGTLHLLVPCEIGGRSLSAGRRLAMASLLGGTATLALEPVRSNMDYGQINLLLMALVVLDVCRSRPRSRGLAIGIAAAVKLTPLAYLLFFAVRRDWRAVGRGIAGFMGATLLALAILPGDSVLYWFHEATDVARPGSVGFVSNQSLYGMLHRQPFVGDHLAVFMWLALCGCVIALGAVAARTLQSRRRPAVESVLVLALVEVLISPISWSHHWSWVAAAPLAASSCWREHRGVVCALTIAIATCIIAPYWWGFRTGAIGFLADNSLVLAGSSVLLTFAGSALPRRTRGRRLPTEPACVRRQPVLK